METTATVQSSSEQISIEEIQPRHKDKQIWGIYFVLCVISVIELFTASSHEVNANNVFAPLIRHMLFLVIGLLLMLFLERTHYRKFFKWSYGFAVISGILMVITLLYGDYINGARRSISIGGLFALQPSEMVKISMALVIAGILSTSQIKKVNDVTTRGTLLCTACVLISSALLFTQGLTNTILLMSISLSMMLIGGVSFKKFFILVGTFIVLAGAFFGVKELLSHHNSAPIEHHELTVPGTQISVGYDTEDLTSKGESKGRSSTWRNRVDRYLKPDKYNEPIDDYNQQEQYSYIAQAHGGIFGVMPGNSRETSRLPLAFSDYIYAIVIEELGLVGGIFVLICYLWLLARAARIASRCQTAYPALLAIGMAVFITFQAIFHMAIVTGVFPVSGQPLPLISKGGTSIIITSVALGIMLSVSRYAARKGEKKEIKEEQKILADEISSENPTRL